MLHRGVSRRYPASPRCSTAATLSIAGEEVSGQVLKIIDAFGTSVLTKTSAISRRSSARLASASIAFSGTEQRGVSDPIVFDYLASLLGQACCSRRSILSLIFSAAVRRLSSSAGSRTS